MTQLVDMTITKADDTTSVVYSAMVPSSGDRVPSIHRAVDTVLPGHRSTVKIVARFNSKQTARRVDLVIDQPYVKTVNGEEVSDSKTIASLSFVLPQDIPESDIQEHVNNVQKILATTMVTDVLESGYAPS